MVMEQETSQPGAASVEPARESPPTILVVEDDADILRQIAFNLERRGYGVRTAITGEEALRVMLQVRPHLLITDIMMPGMDGYELVETLRRDPELADLPVIMLTARSEDVDVTRGYAAGTDLYLTKPFRPAELLAFVDRILSL
ncbi:MAG: response regulator transcription factor [Armatimonadota bacterium]